MDVKRQWVAIVVLGVGAGLSGCRSSLGGLAFWNAKQDGAIAYSAPDVNRQRYDGLSQEFASSGRPLGRPTKGATALGGQPPAPETGLAGMWKNTTASVAGVFTPKPKTETERDATRLDSPSKKVGPEVYVAAARVMENQSRFPEAELQYDKALQAAPGDVNALIGVARLHDRQGQPSKAMQFYDRALKAHPKSALVHNDLGLCYARQKQLDRSIQSLALAVELQPENPRYRNNLATVLVEAGRTDEALAQLSRTGSEAIAHYNIGFLLHKRGQQGEAVQHLQQAIALDPSLTPAREMLAQWAAPAASETGDTVESRVAAAPRYEVGSAYRTGTAAQPISIEMPAASSPDRDGKYHVGDDGASTGTTASISDGPAWRLPPVEE